MLSPAFSHPFPPFRDASAGRCSYNLTLQHCFAAISKVTARSCDLSCDVSCDHISLHCCRLFILAFLTSPTSTRTSMNTLRRWKMVTSTGSCQVENWQILLTCVHTITELYPIFTNCAAFATTKLDSAAHF